MRTFFLTVAVVILTAILLLLLSTAPHPAYAAGYSELIMYEAGVGPNFDRTKIKILWKQVSFEKPRADCPICVGGQSPAEIFAGAIDNPEDYVLISIRLPATDDALWGPTSIRFFYVEKKGFQKPVDRDSGQSPFRY